MSTKHYYKTIIKRDSVKAEYSSETGEIYVTIDRRTKGNHHIMTEYLRIHKDDVQPFTELLHDVLAAASPSQDNKDTNGAKP